ncbi:hypothetical protein ACFL5A_00265 [Gemmatimonadota bacterium]
MAVWDKGIPARRSGGKVKRAPGTLARTGSRGSGNAPDLKAFWGRLIPSAHTVEAVFLLILVLSMAGFAVDWVLKILGLG